VKRKIAILLSAAISAAFAIGMGGCTPALNADLRFQDIKNVILVIGDGMGYNHIENAITYFELERPAFLNENAASVYTTSADNPVTDSAAAATAMATGQKVNNSSIAYDVDGNMLTSISTLAKNAGKKVGIVTTDTLDGATPAGFSSHAKTRGESETIAREQAKSDVDLFLGKASFAYTQSYASFFTDQGYDLSFNQNELALHSSSKKLMATLPNVQSCYYAGHTSDYQLKDMAAFALDFLENENGYFLMIESANIDKFSHENKLIAALCEVRSLFDTVAYLCDRIGKDTALLITADHETGMLKKARDDEPISNNLYGSGGHTFSAVPLYTHNFVWKTKSGFIQNTEIFETCKKLLNA
jgi:alkaline phosphatase